MYCVLLSTRSKCKTAHIGRNNVGRVHLLISVRVTRMFEPSDFEWDAAKARLNDQKHGLGFEFALCVFRDPKRYEYDVIRPEDGEIRLKVLGSVYNRLFSVVFTVREDSCRVISVRPANPKEERIHANRSHEA